MSFICGGNPRGEYKEDYANEVVKAVIAEVHPGWTFEKGTPAWAHLHAWSRRWYPRKTPVEAAMILRIGGGMYSIAVSTLVFPSSVLEEHNRYRVAHGAEPLNATNIDEKEAEAKESE